MNCPRIFNSVNHKSHIILRSQNEMREQILHYRLWTHIIDTIETGSIERLLQKKANTFNKFWLWILICSLSHDSKPSTPFRNKKKLFYSSWTVTNCKIDITEKFCVIRPVGNVSSVALFLFLFLLKKYNDTHILKVLKSRNIKIDQLITVSIFLKWPNKGCSGTW